LLLNLGSGLQYHLDGHGGFEHIFAAEPILTGEIVIVLCAPFMREWARQYMHGRVLVMDSTFGTNKHGYSLFAILAVGHHGNGVPLGFMITKSESTEAITAALKQYRSFLDSGTVPPAPVIRPKTTLTDDSDAEQNALGYDELHQFS
jgi:hypothetical protein